MTNDFKNECLIEEESSDKEFASPEITRNPGIKGCLGDSGDPSEYFNLFFDNEMFLFIVKEINRYAELFFEDKRPLCFHCGHPGLVVRYCRRRKWGFNSYRPRWQNRDEAHAEEEYHRLKFNRISTPSPNGG
ncbi:hypothetical protein NPIL_559361 [Nephila pilipes]|uniref:CCHC-type domain-containing protein n=1 Tax=Nephila pilipes TaxID=299642 RepID=A0A8X6QIS2_NEPPI|nr:hypothetical protein NPIL_559361 [Nephila pilipes]